MAVRTDSASVQAILLDHYDGSSVLTAFISAASKMVDWLATQDVDSELSAAHLTDIETWLAAHCYLHADQIRQSSSTGKASGTFQGQTGMALDSTIYGQMAKTLDITGRLSKLGKEINRGTVQWLGTTYT